MDIHRDIIEAPAYKKIKQFDSKNFTQLIFHVVLKRNGNFFSYILIVPCMLLSLLTMVVYNLSNSNSCLYSFYSYK